jgi:hypothetical protein
MYEEEREKAKEEEEEGEEKERMRKSFVHLLFLLTYLSLQREDGVQSPC